MGDASRECVYSSEFTSISIGGLGGNMNSLPFKQPSALLPITLSLIALAMVLIHFGLYGITSEADEGTPAHIFQLLMLAQVPIVIYFAFKWIPQRPAWAIRILAFQVVAGLAALGAVYFLT